MNDKEISFSETQHFSKWFVVLSIAIVILVFLIQTIIFKLNNKITSGLITMQITIGIIVPLSTLTLLYILKLKTTVSDKLYVQLFPLPTKKISYDDIEQCYAREYKPITEYGGWGILGSFSHGKAYNARGNKGVQLVLKNGKKILIGSQKYDKLEDAINSAIKKFADKQL